MEDVVGFSSEEEEEWRVPKRNIVLKPQKRDFAHISSLNNANSNNCMVFSKSERKKKRKVRSGSLPSERAEFYRHRRLPKGSMRKHPLVTQPDSSPHSSSHDSNSRAMPRSGVAKHPPQNTGTGTGTGTGVKCRESLYSASSSTSKNDNYIPSNITGTTGTTEIMSNVHLKRKGDWRWDLNESILLGNPSMGSAMEEDPVVQDLVAACGLATSTTAGALVSFNGRSNAATAATEAVATRSRKRCVGQSGYSTFNRHSFVVDVDAPFFALLEAIELQSCRASHRLEILQGRRVHGRSMYCTARVLELPAIAHSGLWVSELRMADFGPSRNLQLSEDQIASLEASTISLRHHSRAGLEPLRYYYTGLPGHARRPDMTLAGNDVDPDTVNVSIIHPSHARQSQVDLQRLLQNKNEDTFISSVSIAAFEGFTCSGDLNSNASKVSAAILEGVEDVAPKEPVNCPRLLGISGARRAIGVSVACQLDMDYDYTLYIAQDLTLPDTPIVAIDVEFSDPRTSSMQGRSRHGIGVSTGTNSTSATGSIEDEAALEELSEVNLQAHMQTVGLTGYDPFERLWVDQANYQKIASTAAPISKKKPTPQTRKRQLPVGALVGRVQLVADPSDAQPIEKVVTRGLGKPGSNAVQQSSIGMNIPSISATKKPPPGMELSTSVVVARQPSAAYLDQKQIPSTTRATKKQLADHGAKEGLDNAASISKGVEKKVSVRLEQRDSDAILPNRNNNKALPDQAGTNIFARSGEQRGSLKKKLSSGVAAPFNFTESENNKDGMKKREVVPTFRLSRESLLSTSPFVMPEKNRVSSSEGAPAPSAILPRKDEKSRIRATANSHVTIDRLNAKKASNRVAAPTGISQEVQLEARLNSKVPATRAKAKGNELSGQSCWIRASANDETPSKVRKEESTSMQVRRRHYNTKRTSLRMMVLVAWGMLTWKTTNAPISCVSTDTLGLPDKLFRPNLVWKNNSHQEAHSHFFKLRNSGETQEAPALP